MSAKQFSMSQIIGKEGVFVDGDWIESKDQDPNGSVRLIQLADIGDGYFINKSNRYLTKEKAIDLKCTFLKPNDVLIARMPDPLGRACIFPPLKTECVTVVDVCIVRPDSNIVSPEFLKFLINNQEFRRRIHKYITGTTRQRISRGNLEKIKFTVPQLEEQKRIVELLNQAESLRQKRKQARDLLDEYLKSVFWDMFGDPIKNFNPWEKTRLGKYLKVKHGYAFKSEHFSDQGEYILLTPGNFFESGGYRDRGDKQKYYVGNVPDGFILKKDDLLVAMTEQAPGLLGSPIIIPSSGQYLHNQRLGKVEYDHEKLNRFYLFHLFNQTSIRHIIESNATGTKVQHTSPTKIEDIVISFPPIGDQNKLAQIVIDTEELKQNMLKQSEKLDNQFQALMQKSFANI